MDSIKKLIAGSLTLVGLAAIGYKVYEAKKLRDAIKEEQIIDISIENVEEKK